MTLHSSGSATIPLGDLCPLDPLLVPLLNQNPGSVPYLLTAYHLTSHVQHMSLGMNYKRQEHTQWIWVHFRTHPMNWVHFCYDTTRNSQFLSIRHQTSDWTRRQKFLLVQAVPTQCMPDQSLLGELCRTADQSLSHTLQTLCYDVIYRVCQKQ